MKIRLVGAELFHADPRTDGRRDGRTDMTKLIVAFRSYANAPKKYVRLIYIYIYIYMYIFEEEVLTTVQRHAQKDHMCLQLPHFAVLLM